MRDLYEIWAGYYSRVQNRVPNAESASRASAASVLTVLHVLSPLIAATSNAVAEMASESELERAVALSEMPGRGVNSETDAS